MFSLPKGKVFAASYKTNNQLFGKSLIISAGLENYKTPAILSIFDNTLINYIYSLII